MYNFFFLFILYCIRDMTTQGISTPYILLPLKAFNLYSETFKHRSIKGTWRGKKLNGSVFREETGSHRIKSTHHTSSVIPTILYAYMSLSVCRNDCIRYQAHIRVINILYILNHFISKCVKDVGDW